MVATMRQPGAVSRLLKAWCLRDDEALDPLISQVYDDFKIIAKARLREHKESEHTPENLISEVYLRLRKTTVREFKNPGQFFAYINKVMRHILLEDARHQGAAKRGGHEQVLSLDDDQMRVETLDQSLSTEMSISQALQALGTWNNRAARVIELKFFGGYTRDQISDILHISQTSVARAWREGRDWLAGILTDSLNADLQKEPLLQKLPLIPADTRANDRGRPGATP